MQIQLDSAEKLRTNWPFILSEGLLPQLISEGVVSVAFQAAINADCEWRVYSGRADLKAIYRAFGETIGDATPYQQFVISPQTAFEVAGLIMQREPAVLAKLIEMNGGTMPDVLPPIVPAPPAPPTPPAVEPEPTSEDEGPVDNPDEEPPVDPPADEDVPQN